MSDTGRYIPVTSPYIPVIPPGRWTCETPAEYLQINRTDNSAQREPVPSNISLVTFESADHEPIVTVNVDDTGRLTIEVLQ